MKIRTLASLLAVALALACGSDPQPAASPPAAAEPEIAAETQPEVSPPSAPVRDDTSPNAIFSDEPEGLDEAVAGAENRSPVIQTVEIAPVDAIHTDDDVTAMPRAEDPDGDALTFRYRWTVNSHALPVDGPTLPSSYFQRGDRIGLTVEADDGTQSSHPLRIDPLVVANSEPRITSKPGPLEADGTFRYKIAAEDPDADHLFHYALREHPEGMRIDEVEGSIVWAPRPDQAGVHPVTIAVDDRHEGVATQSFDLTIEFTAVEAPAAAAP